MENIHILLYISDAPESADGLGVSLGGGVSGKSKT